VSLVFGLFVCVFFVLDDGGLDFGDCCSTVIAFFVTGNDVDDAFSSWKMEVSL
jgi:hypothetical protein